jgi:hypothetical protein
MGSQVANRLPSLQQLLTLKCFIMACKSNVCPDSPREDLMKAILFSHEKGYLLTNKDASAFANVYRVKSETEVDKIPDVENGDLAYVNFAVSEEKNPFVLLKMLRGYVNANPEVKELIYFRRNSDADFKRIFIKRSPK